MKHLAAFAAFAALLICASPAAAATINGGNGHDYLHGTGGADRMFGGWGNDGIFGYGGNDYIEGGWGDDTLAGHQGNDEIVGGPGNDTINGGDGNDNLAGGFDNVRDVIYCGPGNFDVVWLRRYDIAYNCEYRYAV